MKKILSAADIQIPETPVDIELPLSKSISNRLLIIYAIARRKIPDHIISDANDSRLLVDLLRQDSEIYDCQDAGTTARFLTAYLALQNKSCTITGSRRMRQRPIGPLIDGLLQLGANIRYLENFGSLPVQLGPSFNFGQKTGITIRGNVSSQFISAILLIAPMLAGGLTLHIQRPILSKSYIDMTVALMQSCGINVQWLESELQVTPDRYKLHEPIVEYDWSSASYFYSAMVFSEIPELRIRGLRLDSIQGDRMMAEIGNAFGIRTESTQHGVRLRKTNDIQPLQAFDFSSCPDLAQTVIVMLAGMGWKAELTGLETLPKKETDRLNALKTELEKLNVKMRIHEDCSVSLDASAVRFPDTLKIDTYTDHRMAMAFAPLLFKVKTLTFNDASVVSKSFPSFWNEFSKLISL